MKKLIPIMLVIVMMLSAVSASATEINWTDLETQGAEMIAKGEFVTFDDIAVKMWVPTSFSAYELTDEDLEDGYVGYYATDDEAYAISVMCFDADGMTLEEYKEVLAEYGATDVEDVVVNGMTAVSYVLEEDDVVCISSVLESGYLLEVAASPKSDEGFASVVAFVMASIQAA